MRESRERPGYIRRPVEDLEEGESFGEVRRSPVSFATIVRADARIRFRRIIARTIFRQDERGGVTAGGALSIPGGGGGDTFRRRVLNKRFSRANAINKICGAAEDFIERSVGYTASGELSARGGQIERTGTPRWPVGGG